MFCNKCGNQIPDDSRLCCYCGAPVAVPAPKPVAVAEPAPAEEAPQPREESKPKKKLWVRLCAIAMAVVLLASLFLVLYTQVFTVELWVLTGEYYETPEEYQDKYGERLVLCTYEYDRHGNMIEKWDARTWAFAGDPEKRELYTYEYNKNGDCVSIEIDHGTIYESAGLDIENTVWEYDYDYDGKLKTEKYQVRENEETLRATYEYDGDKLSEIIYGNPDANYEKREFDEDGNLVKMHRQEYADEDGDGERERLTTTYKYSYDKKGRLTGIKYYYDDVFSREEEIHYDSKGHMDYVAALNAEGEETNRLEYVTDKHGNVIGCKISGAELPYTFEYKKIRVSKKQALKLINEQETAPYRLISYQTLPYNFQYRIEK